MHISELEQKPKGVFFDWDATLTDPWKVVDESVNSTLKHFNETPLSMEELHNICTRNKDSYLTARYFPEKWKEMRKYFKEVLENCNDTPSALPDAEEVLQKLQKAGIFIALISNKHEELLLEDVDNMGWRGYFDFIIGRSDKYNPKPSPEMAEQTLIAMKEQTGYDGKPHDDIFFVGDSLLDAMCAKSFGCIHIVFDNYLRDEDLIGFNYHRTNNHTEFSKHLDIIL